MALVRRVDEPYRCALQRVTLGAMATAPRTGLVLAGGGVVGGAWMVGALYAIATETGWDPGTADAVLGTSAGAMIGALLTSAVPPWLLMAYGANEDIDHPSASTAGRFGTGLKLHWSFPRPVLGSPRLALRSLREPWKYGPAGIIAWLPQGVISTEPLKGAVRQVVPRGWTAHRNLWITAIDYETGQRVVFGRPGAPPADLADAVAASCAIPGFYHPVEIHGRRYVDGGMYSPANLDVMRDSDAELVVCLNPMSSRHRGGLLEPTGPIAAFVRGDNRRLIDREALSLKRAGKRIVLIEPQAEDIEVMGLNYMNRRHIDRIAETAVRTTTSALRGGSAGHALSRLPEGLPNRLRRPKGSPASWPAELFPPSRRSA
jgi:NTE family protein